MDRKIMFEDKPLVTEEEIKEALNFCEGQVESNLPQFTHQFQ